MHWHTAPGMTFQSVKHVTAYAHPMDKQSFHINIMYYYEQLDGGASPNDIAPGSRASCSRPHSAADTMPNWFTWRVSTYKYITIQMAVQAMRSKRIQMLRENANLLPWLSSRADSNRRRSHYAILLRCSQLSQRSFSYLRMKRTTIILWKMTRHNSLKQQQPHQQRSHNARE